MNDDDVEGKIVIVLNKKSIKLEIGKVVDLKKEELEEVKLVKLKIFIDECIVFFFKF